MKKTLYRVILVPIVIFLPILLAAAQMIQAAPDYWSDLKDCYRMAPKAFRKGGSL